MKANCKNGLRVERPDKQMVVKLFNNPERVVLSSENDEWYFALVDICRAIGIKNHHDVKARLDQDRLHKFKVAAMPQDIGEGVDYMDLSSAPNAQLTTFCNEKSVFYALFSSNKPEARQFREWTYEVLSTLRKKEGIATYNLAKLTEKETQDRILDHIDHAKYDGWTVYYDEATDWWFAEGMDRKGDVLWIPVDDPYGRPFNFPADYEPNIDVSNPSVFKPCPWYDCKPVDQD